MAKSFSKSFYNSQAWIQARNAYVAERTSIDGGMCENCHENVGEELHHKTHLTLANIEDYDVCLNPDNLIFLCKDCHFKAHREIILQQFCGARQSRKPILTNGCYFNDDGDLVKMKKYIVWGSPASGKTMYVKNNMQDGDLVVNLDFIKYAISLQSKLMPNNLLPIAMDVRDYLYQLIEGNKVDCKNVWVIATLPNRKERNSLAKRFNAELIYIKSDYHECIMRAGKDGNCADKELQRALIDKFFEQLQE